MWAKEVERAREQERGREGKRERGERKRGEKGMDGWMDGGREREKGGGEGVRKGIEERGGRWG